MENMENESCNMPGIIELYLSNGELYDIIVLSQYAFLKSGGGV